MGDLQKDTNTVTGFSLCILTCTMLQMFYDPESIRNSFMCFLSFDVDNCADTTVVMLKFLAIQALFFSRYFLHNLRPLYQKNYIILYFAVSCFLSPLRMRLLLLRSRGIKDVHGSVWI